MLSVTSITTVAGASTAQKLGMEQTTSCLKVIGLLGLLAVLIPLSATAETSGQSPSASLAFARYVASIQEPDPFADSGPLAVAFEASLPSLYKQMRVLTIRGISASERSEYILVGAEGDVIAAQEVIGQYLKIQAQMEGMPFSSLAVTPANYRFRYKGEVGAGTSQAYVYQITPKRKRAGLMEGQLWIDSATGAAILQTGRLVKPPSPFLGGVGVVRDIKLVNGSPCARVTHITFETPRAGRAELTITEIPLAQGDDLGTEPAPLVRKVGPE